MSNTIRTTSAAGVTRVAGMMDELTAFYGEPVFVYTRRQAIEDGCLVDVTEWASANKGFLGGFTCPVAVTSALWARLEGPEAKSEGTRRAAGAEDTRGRAYDVLWMAAVALRRSLACNDGLAAFVVLVGGRKLDLWAVIDGDGVTIGFPGDF